MNKKAEQLADFIEQNPECQFDIDNDCWDITDRSGKIIKSSKDGWETEWYSHSSNYGAGLAEALVALLNRRGFNIVAQAV